MAEMKARIVLDSSGYSSGVSKVISDTDNMINATKKAKESINAMKTNVAIMIQAKDNASQAINRIKSNATELVKSNFRLEIAAIDKTKSVLSGIRDSIFNLKTLAAGIILGGTGKVGYDWTIGNAISNEDYLATLQTVTHDKNKGTEALKWSYQDAANTPFDAKQVVAGVTQLATSELDYKKYLNPLGDAAAAFNKPLEQAIFAMGKLKSGQYGIAVDMFRDFGISNQDWMKQGVKFSKSGEMQMSDPQKAVDIVTKIINQKYGGLMATKSGTAGGMLSNIGDSIQAMGRGLAGIDGEGAIMKGGLFDNFKQQLTVIMPLLERVKNSKAFAELQKDIGNLATAGGQKLTEFLKGFDDPKKIAQYKNEFKQFIADVKAGASAAKDISKAIGTIATTLKPVINLVSAHPKLFIGLFAGFEAGKGALTAIGILKNLREELQYLPTVLGLFKLGAVDAFKNALSVFKTFVGFMIANPLPILAIIAVLALLYEAWIHDWGGIREKTHDAIEAIKKDWEELKELFAHPIQAIVNYSKQGEVVGLGVDSKAGTASIGGRESTKMGGHNALGTNYWKGGLTEINEGNRGEIAILPSGSKVIPHDLSSKMMGGTNVVINMNGLTIREESDIDKIATALAKKLTLTANNMA